MLHSLNELLDRRASNAVLEIQILLLKLSQWFRPLHKVFFSEQRGFQKSRSLSLCRKKVFECTLGLKRLFQRFQFAYVLCLQRNSFLPDRFFACRNWVIGVTGVRFFACLRTCVASG